MPYIRFVISNLDRDSGKKLGIFQAVSNLEYEGVLLKHEQTQYDEVYKWFRKKLKKPGSFSKSSKPHAKKVAISWFKDSAKEHISKMYALASILNAHGVHTEMPKTEKPGYVVYEDQFQVAAEPFNETAV